MLHCVYTKNMKSPSLKNAFFAASYIIFIVVALTLATEPLRDKDDTLFTPVVVLSVLTLSVAVMAYLFFYDPMLLFLEGKRREAVDVFLKTVFIFGIFTGLSILLLSAGII